MKIAIDCLGGDHSPAANVEGALLALEDFSDLAVVLYGDETAIKSELSGKTYPADRVEIINAPEAVDGNDKPIDAIRLKKDSSMIRAVKDLRENEEIKALVSCGATGILVGASILRIGRLEGVRRPAFCPVLPTMNGGIVGVCDSGANIDASAEQLKQNAILGSA